ncbi:MAG: UDP-4-amino-4,6-dideoxy-N-acetyl-beta-L-altrosamine transaminase [Vulcanimicrobiaceae bacterium]
MIPYARQSIDEEDIARVVEVLRSDFLTQGPVVPEFEHAVSRRCGSTHAVATSNATAALHLACAALGVGPGDTVWTSPNTFVASANCARYCGAGVDFVDIDPATFTIGIAALTAKLEQAAAAGRSPKAIVAVDFAGQPCHLEALAALKDRYGFYLIEDASHAVGASYRGEPVGNGRYADITIFSFHPVKILTTGEGGMALTSNANLAERMALLRSHGVTRDPSLMDNSAAEPWEYEQLALGFNYRMTEIQAALGLSQLARLDTFLERRRAIAARYDCELADLPMTLPRQNADGSSAYHLYPVRIHSGEAAIDRRDVYDALVARGIRPNVHYIPVHLQPYYRALGFAPGDFPQAEAYYREALSLPMYAALGDEEQTTVIQALHDTFGELQ